MNKTNIIVICILIIIFLVFSNNIITDIRYIRSEFPTGTIYLLPQQNKNSRPQYLVLDSNKIYWVMVNLNKKDYDLEYMINSVIDKKLIINLRKHYDGYKKFNNCND